jgi:methylated-DNA-[protein]-cysteine S-methyltransferase
MTQLERALRAFPPPLSPDAERLARRFAEEVAAGGGADVAFATVDSPFGPLTAATTSRGLVRLAFPDEGPDAVVDFLARRLSPRIVEAPARLDAVRRELDEYFSGGRRSFEMALDWALIGAFGRRVLRATARIPFGAVSSYREVAARAGSPAGSRAAGGALGANPIPIVIPCHRVLRTGGGLGGYAGGLERKRFLLELEGALEPTPE